MRGRGQGLVLCLKTEGPSGEEVVLISSSSWYIDQTLISWVHIVVCGALCDWNSRIYITRLLEKDENRVVETIVVCIIEGINSILVGLSNLRHLGLEQNSNVTSRLVVSDTHASVLICSCILWDRASCWDIPSNWTIVFHSCDSSTVVDSF